MGTTADNAPQRLRETQLSRLVINSKLERRMPQLLSQEFRSLAQKLMALNQIVATCIGRSTLQRGYLTVDGVRMSGNRNTTLGQLADAGETALGLLSSRRLLSQATQPPKVEFFLEFNFFHRSCAVITFA